MLQVIWLHYNTTVIWPTLKYSIVIISQLISPSKTTSSHQPFTTSTLLLWHHMCSHSDHKSEIQLLLSLLSSSFPLLTVDTPRLRTGLLKGGATIPHEIKMLGSLQFPGCINDWLRLVIIHREGLQILELGPAAVCLVPLWVNSGMTSHLRQPDMTCELFLYLQTPQLSKFHHNSADYTTDNTTDY